MTGRRRRGVSDPQIAYRLALLCYGLAVTVAGAAVIFSVVGYDINIEISAAMSCLFLGAAGFATLASKE